ncbi:MFS transporter [Mycobacterium sp.]|uniref:MFS transporter n=1 Tax=Mycobacterium sp. TaxID=1785 RepID=UPI003D6C0746
MGTAIGNFMEWYDFGVYGFLATTIAQVFYPADSASGTGLIATFGTLAAAFAVRPLGGFVFGPLGDRIGRKRVLMMTILLMALATTVSGVLPGHDSIGVWASTLLIATRLVQGFSTGGEYVGAMTYIGEHAPDRRRGMLGGFLPLGTLSGYLVAAVLVSMLKVQLSVDEMLSWGWRIPFLVGAPFGVIALYMRLRIDESPAFEEMREKQKESSSAGWQQFKHTVAQQWRPLLVCMGLVMTFNINSYMLTGYLPTYFKEVGRISGTAGLMLIGLVLLALLSAVVFVATLSDRIGVKPIMRTGCALLIVGSVPAFLLIRFGNSYPVMFIGVLLIGMMMLCFYSTEPATLPALFPTNVRYSAVAIGYNISVSAFGGTTPLIAESLVHGLGNVMVPAYMLMVAGVIGLLTLVFTPEVAGKRLPGSGPSVANEEEARALAEREYID